MVREVVDLMRAKRTGLGVSCALRSLIGVVRKTQRCLHLVLVPVLSLGCDGPRGEPDRHPEGMAGRLYRPSIEETGSPPSDFLGRAATALRIGEIDAAIRMLERPGLVADEKAPRLNDLAVAYLARFRRDGRPADLLQALECAERAAGGAPDSPEVLYNRALLLSEVPLPHTAVAAWRSFLRREEESRWAESAVAGLARMERATAPERRFRELALRLEAGPSKDLGEVVSESCLRHPLEVRKLAERELLRSWGEAVLAGDEGGARARLAAASAVARALSDRRGDRMLFDAVEAIERASVGGGAARTLLAEAHADYGLGMLAYEARRLAEAARRLERARRVFESAASPFELLAELHLGILDYLAALETGAERLETLARRTRAGSYPALAADVHWMLGLAEVGRGRIGGALPHYLEARRLHERVSGAAGSGAVEQLLAEAFEDRGQVSRAWEHRLRALRALPYLEGPRRRHTTLNDAAIALTARRRTRLAQLFLQEELENARAWGQAEFIAEAHRLRARLLAAEGRPEEAVVEAGRAFEELARCRPSAQIARLEASLWLTRGMALAASDPETALAALDRGWQMQRSRGFLSERLAYVLARARASRVAGDAEAAEEALAAGIEEYERLRAETPSGLDRGEVFHWAQQTFDELLRVRWERRGPAAATLEVAERARGRTLLDRWLPESALAGFSPELLTGAIAELPDDHLLALYHVLPERVLAWRVHGGRVEQLELPAKPDELRRMVGALESALADPLPAARHREARSLRRELFRALVAPLRLPAGLDRLVLIPDRFLSRVPFAVLGEPELLIERVAVSLAPSVGLAALTRRRAVDLTDLRPPTLLVMSDPRLGEDDLRRFPPLAGAREEAAEIAGLYGESFHLTASRATVPALLENASRYSVLHYAGHSAAELDLEEGVLLLAPENGGDGRLTVRDLFEGGKLDWELVVLAACESAAPLELGREGLFGMAAGFMGAGAAAVVATRTEIDDREGRELMTGFHRHYAERRDAALALREAWLDLRGKDIEWDELRQLSAFVVLGG